MQALIDEPASSTAAVPASRAWSEAMRDGRTATLHHQYDDAVSAFERAVDADDARVGPAYAEMGYAQLLGGQTDKALESFDEAEQWETRPQVRAQIFFNGGDAHLSARRTCADRPMNHS